VLRGVIVNDKDEKTIEHIKTILRENVRPYVFLAPGEFGRETIYGVVSSGSRVA